MIKCKIFCLQVLLMVVCSSYGQSLKVPRPQAVVVDSESAGTDSELAGTGFAGAVQSGSKYFQDMYSAQVSPDVMEFGHVRETPDDWEQRFERINLSNLKQRGKVYKKYFLYAHVPAKDHYEVGHKRGNEHHFIERHEKAHPHEGEFKTKVRWGDKHGGYGEHYWDYNHAGHGGHDGEETQQQETYAAYEEPETGNGKKYKRGTALNEDAEFIDEDSKQRVLSGVSSKHGGNYRRLPELERNRRQYNYKN